MYLQAGRCVSERLCAFAYAHLCIPVCVRLSTADDSVPVGQLLYVLILICAVDEL